MSSLIYKIVWNLINSFIIIIESITLIYLYTIRKVEYIRLLFDYSTKKKNNNVNRAADKTTSTRKTFDLEFIHTNIYHVKKIPLHFVLILNENYFNLNTLVNIVKWCQAAGIKYISFYDYQGEFESNYTELCESVKSYQTAAVNTSSDNNKIVTNYFTPKDGKPEIVSLCKQFCYAAKANQLKSGEVTLDLVDKKLNEYLNKIPDPDVAVYFSNVCGTYGLLPWQIRLTEFFCIGNQSSLNIHNFMNVLNKYSKCEQRFGK